MGFLSWLGIDTRAPKVPSVPVRSMLENPTLSRSQLAQLRENMDGGYSSAPDAPVPLKILLAVGKAGKTGITMADLQKEVRFAGTRAAFWCKVREARTIANLVSPDRMYFKRERWHLVD